MAAGSRAVDMKAMPGAHAPLWWAAVTFALGACTSGTSPSPVNAATGGSGYVADGRKSLDELFSRYSSLSQDRGWQMETVYEYPGEQGLAIRAWRTTRQGEALWILAGIHGEEPAGPNAIAASLGRIGNLADASVPIVVIPLCNPRAYRNNWRYPNTAERDWRKGGYSVGDSEYLLPDLATGEAPRAAAAPGPETRALTAFALRLAAAYPPRLVLDLHEDELSTAGGYIYSQGTQADDNPVGAEVIRALQASGMELRLSGHTRFGEPIVNGVISRDDKGSPIRDGSIDELLASRSVFIDGEKRPGPSARTVLVVETPAFSGSRLAVRVAAQSAVLHRAPDLWKLSASVPP